jgi:plastocyanin
MAAWTWSGQSCAQDLSVSLKVAITRGEKANAKMTGGKVPDASNVAVWLVPLDRMDGNALQHLPADKPPQLVQRQKTFEPHVLIVPVGTRVEFPNKDPFFHNIFSLYDGRRFDLGLYEAGTTRSIVFDRAGVSFLFCNIHAEMSAVFRAFRPLWKSDHSRRSQRAVPDERLVRAGLPGRSEGIDAHCDDIGLRAQFGSASYPGECQLHAGP